MKSHNFSIFLFLGKFGAKFLGLLTKLIKFTKLGLATASFASYALLFTWKFAVVILAAVGFHESGHVWAMKKCGIKTKGFYFIPFFGGAAVPEEDFKTRGNEAFIALMGPIWGLLLALAVYAIYYFTREPLFAAVTGWMALINLINLLPINPLDGGRITKSIAFSIHSTFGVVFLIVGLISMIYLTVALKFSLFLILMIAGSLELLGEHKDYLIGKVKAKFFPLDMIRAEFKPAMNAFHCFLVFSSYTGLIGVLLYLMILTNHIPGSAVAMEALIDKNPGASGQDDNTMPIWLIILMVIFALGLLLIIYNIFRNLVINIKNARKLESALTDLKTATENIPLMIQSLVEPYDDINRPDFEKTIANRIAIKYIWSQEDFSNILVLKDYINYRKTLYLEQEAQKELQTV